jgi:hypothetical protein
MAVYQLAIFSNVAQGGSITEPQQVTRTKFSQAGRDEDPLFEDCLCYAHKKQEIYSRPDTLRGSGTVILEMIQ